MEVKKGVKMEVKVNNTNHLSPLTSSLTSSLTSFLTSL